MTPSVDLPPLPFLPSAEERIKMVRWGTEIALAERERVMRAVAAQVPAVDLSQMLICPRCNVDRKQAPCGDPHYGMCPMTGTAAAIRKGE